MSLVVLLSLSSLFSLQEAGHDGGVVSAPTRPSEVEANAASSRDASEEPREPKDPWPRLTTGWALMQFVPSPGLVGGESGAHGAMDWQLTPLLYSFGVDRRLNRFRLFVVEPLYRTSGSIELHFSPEYVGRPGDFERRIGFRAGGRVTFPLLERGDTLALSLGASFVEFSEARGASFDLGLSTLFGGFGLRFTASPWFDDALFKLSLVVRYF